MSVHESSPPNSCWQLTLPSTLWAPGSQGVEPAGAKKVPKNLTRDLQGVRSRPALFQLDKGLQAVQEHLGKWFLELSWREEVAGTFTGTYVSTAEGKHARRH